MDLSRYIDATRNDASAAAGGTPSSTAWPCRPRRSTACRISSVRPTHSKAWSAPYGRTPRTASTVSGTADASTKCVAPKSRATASLAGLTSTATIGEAPASRAPWSTFSPIPPVPITTTVSPCSTRARFRTAPTPVSTPHPISAADVSGMPRGIRTACTARTTVRSAKAELDAKLYTSRPPCRNGFPGIPIEARHIVGRPRSHSAHVPQLASVDSAT